MPCCCLCLVDSYPPIHQFTDSSIQWIRYVSSIYNGPGPGTVGGTWYRRHSCLDMVPSLPQGILHSSRWDKMSMKTKFITHRMPWLCYSSICTMFLCFYKYSVLSGLGACTPIWEAWNRSVCQSGFTEATIGILDRKWFHTGNLKPPKPLEGWGSEGQRKNLNTGTAVKQVGDSQEMPDVAGKTPPLLCASRCTWSVVASCSLLPSPSYSSASHWWNLIRNLLARTSRKGSV